ncbi:hypothetical protein GW17_00047453 [Ensete ventricosum]|nr:hypothetical protein GW17_00047453 [Ensete ventricosum]
MMVKRSYRPDMDPRSSLGIRPRFGRAGSSPGVRLDFAEGFGKIARNTSRDYRRKTVRLTTKNVGGCRITGALGRSEDNAVRNSPGVRWELVESIRRLLGWHKRVRRKKTKTRRKIIKGSRKACRD